MTGIRKPFHNSRSDCAALVHDGGAERRAADTRFRHTRPLPPQPALQLVLRCNVEAIWDSGRIPYPLPCLVSRCSCPWLFSGSLARWLSLFCSTGPSQKRLSSTALSDSVSLTFPAPCAASCCLRTHDPLWNAARLRLVVRRRASKGMASARSTVSCRPTPFHFLFVLMRCVLCPKPSRLCTPFPNCSSSHKQKGICTLSFSSDLRSFLR